ncbi:MAG TPA: ABC transporter substrate-binding protein [Candidatus Binatia bacterium]|nr:ABC transporter substrate-binding protein [Candidatus Binatia bacterium]
MNITRRSAIGLGAAALLAPHAVRAQGVVSIRAAGVPEDSITPALWAQESGIFRRYGLDVQVDAQRSGSAVAAGVAGGAYQFGKSSLMALIAAHAHNVPIMIIAPAGMYDASNPITGLLVKTDSPVKTGADLNGKTIAVSSLGDLYTVGTYAWLEKTGGDWSSVKLVELPISAIFEAVVGGRVDAGGTIVPDLQVALATGRVRSVADTNAAIAPRFIYTAWFTTADYVKNNRPIVQKFRAALRESVLYTNTHKAQTVEVFARFSGMDPAVVAKMNRTDDGLTLDPRLVQPLINATAKYKVIPKAFNAREFIAT